MFTEMSHNEMVQTNGGVLPLLALGALLLLSGCSDPEPCPKCQVPAE